MQIALISTLEPSVDDPATPRGLLRLGGKSIAAHQLDTVLALGCERVVCLAEGLPGEVLALQHAAERAGAQFQIATDGLSASRAIRADDEVLVLSDGLVASAETVGTVLGGRNGVVVQPVDSGIAAGYERIDLNHAGAGVLRLPGRLAEGLTELPRDWNPISALLRMAVQASTRQVVLPQTLVAEGSWVLVRSDHEAHQLEPQWLRRHTAQSERGGPGRWLVARLVERLGPALLHAGTSPAAVAAGGAALAAIALLLAWFGVFAAAFLVLGLAWLVRQGAAVLARVHGVRVRPVWFQPEAIFRIGGDGICALIAAWNFSAVSAERNGLAVGGFVAVTLMGLLRLVEMVFGSRPWSKWVIDRLLLNLALAVASLSGVFDLALRGGVLIVLATAIAAAQRSLTQSETAESAAERGPERLTRP